MLKENSDDSILYRLIPIIGIIGVFVYILSMTVPAWINMALVLASFSGILVAALGDCDRFSLKLPLVLPIGIFVLLSFLSILMSIDLKTSLEPTLLMIPALLIYFLIIELFNINHVKLLYLAFSIVAIIISITLLQVYFDSHAHSRYVWIAEAKHPLLVVPNDLIFISLIAPLSFSLLYQKPISIMGILAFISLLLSLSVVVFFQTRGAVLTLLFSVGCAAILLCSKRVKALAILIVLAIVLVSIVVLLDYTQNFLLYKRITNDSSLGGRIQLWLVAWSMFLDEPLFGHGIQTFRLLLNSYSQTTNIPVEVTSWAHNLYLETLVGQGIIGLASLLTVLLNSLWISWKTRKAKQKEVRILSMGALAAMLGFCFAAIFEISFIRYWSVTLFFSLLAIITVLYFLSGLGNRDSIDNNLEKGVISR
jgi:O-antigen ligase